MASQLEKEHLGIKQVLAPDPMQMKIEKDESYYQLPSKLNKLPKWYEYPNYHGIIITQNVERDSMGTIPDNGTGKL